MKQSMVVGLIAASVAVGGGTAWAVESGHHASQASGRLSPTTSPSSTVTAPASRTPSPSATPIARATSTVSGGASPLGHQGGIDAHNLVRAAELAGVPGADTTRWIQYTDDKEPTLICQGNWLSTLSPSHIEQAKFLVTESHGAGYPVVREALLSFPTVKDAQKAQATITEWIRSCPASIQPDYMSGYAVVDGTPAPTPLTVGAFKGVRGLHRIIYGTGGALATYWQFAGVSGNRVMAFEYSSPDESGGAHPDAPFVADLPKAAARAAV